MSNEDTSAFITAVELIIAPVRATLAKIQESIDTLQTNSHTQLTCPNTGEIIRIKERFKKEEEKCTKNTDRSKSITWDIAKMILTAIISIVVAYLVFKLGLK